MSRAAASSLLLLIPLVSGHAIMTKPTPRPGTNTGSGIKLQPFVDAQKIANAGCGGRNNYDPGTTVPLQTYRAGATVEIEWKLTIPHPADNTANGVRVALHVSAQTLLIRTSWPAGWQATLHIKRCPQAPARTIRRTRYTR